MAHPDLNQLLNSLLPFAKRLLAEHGEFYPLEARKPNGEIVAVGAYDGDEHPPSQNLIDFMTQAFSQQAKTGELRAAAIVTTFVRFRRGKRKNVMLCVPAWSISQARLLTSLCHTRRQPTAYQILQLFATARTPKFFACTKLPQVSSRQPPKWLL